MGQRDACPSVDRNIVCGRCTGPSVVIGDGGYKRPPARAPPFWSGFPLPTNAGHDQNGLALGPCSNSLAPVSEFVVVGGGIFGCATAFELARRGAEVVVLEADTVASGASGGPGHRGVRANRRDARELALVRMAQEIWPTLDELLGVPIGFVRTGELELFEQSDSRESAARIVARQRNAGIDCEVIERDALRAIEPNLSDAVIGAVHCLADGTVDQTTVTHAYADAARRLGVGIRQATTATTIRSRGSLVTSVETNRGDAVTVGRAVVLLANQASATLLSNAGIEIGIVPVFPQTIFTEATDAGPKTLVGHLERPLSAKPHLGGVQISGGRLGRVNSATGQGQVVDAEVEANLADAVAVFPGLDDVGIREAVALTAESVGPDLVPIIDRVPGIKNLWVGAGWTGHGFALAPAVARLLAQWVLDGDQPAEFAPLAWR